MSIYQDAHARAFSVAAMIPTRCQQVLQNRIGQLLETGVSFREGKKVLLPLCADLLKNPVELA